LEHRLRTHFPPWSGEYGVLDTLTSLLGG
jgi:hypothetical protein